MIHGIARTSSIDATGRRSLRALIALAALAAFSAPAAHATPPGTNGRIAFMRPTRTTTGKRGRRTPI